MTFVQRTVLPLWYKYGPSKRLKWKRVQFIDKLSGGQILSDKELRVLDVGCANGKDFVKLLKDYAKLDIHGLDLDNYDIVQPNFTMHVGDAEKIDFPDRHFDLTISMGVLEHVQPMEKLCKVISEIDRVSKSYFVLVPCISTVIEPHVGKPFWQLRDHNAKKAVPYGLNYFSDEAWLQFEGFKDAKVARYSYVPFLITSLVIYKT